MENNKGGDIIAHFYGRVDEIFCLSSFCSDQRSLEQGIRGKTDRPACLPPRRGASHHSHSLQSSPPCKGPAAETLLLALPQEALKALFPL